MVEIDGYCIKEKIYESSNSIIYIGTQEHDNKPVAIKMMAKQHPTQEEIAKFELDYKICADMNIDGVLKMYLTKNSGHNLFIVMEHFDGKSLNNIISYKKLQIKEFIKLGIKIVDVLGQIHAQKVIHKDINPSNILWNPDTEQIKIIDFGISTQLKQETQEAINPKGLEGTLTYIAPEQTGRMNRKIDYRTDFYSLGVTFYELLTGQKPFITDDVLEMIHFHIAKEPVRPNEVNKNIPKTISDIILKLMSKNAEDRYQSSFGIKYDLEKCLEYLINNEEIKEFKIGEKDIPEQFEISQKLYGRDTEINALMSKFDYMSEKEISQMVLVTGYSGIGKSSLVNEINKPVLAKRGYFVSGKFDQLSNNTPYTPFAQAFSGLIRHILTEDEGKIVEWKKRILDAVGSLGQLITNIVPQLEAIIGSQTEVPELPPQQAQNRFNILFQNFIKALATKEHPLVIFIDDLQWADLPTLKLLELINTDSDIKNLLIIGAYRENDVDSAHPLMVTIREIAGTGKEIDTIRLTPLDSGSITLLISDTFKCDNFKTKSLAALSFQKTAGNPFFLYQFLKSVYEDNLIYFDIQNGNWDWDVEKIKEKGYTDNVVDLMINKMKKLPQQAQEILKMAACCGNEFDINTLSIITSKLKLEIAEELWIALQADFIIPLNNNYKLINNDINNLNVLYKFSHDRIQQAAYSLIEEDVKKHLHLKIGKLLLDNTPEDMLDEKIFDIANHLNLGVEYIANQNEKSKLLDLNLQAGIKARKSSAYDIALRYFETGICLLSKDCWETQYDITLVLYLEASEAAYLSTNFEVTDKYVEIAIQHARELLDQAKVYEVKIQSLIAQNKRVEAVMIATQILKCLGVKLPQNAQMSDVLIGFLSSSIRSLNKDIVKLPVMTNKTSIAAMRILYMVMSSAYIINPSLFALIVFRLLILSLKYGIHDKTIYGVGGNSIMMFTLGNFKSGLKSRDMYVNLYKKLNLIETKASYLFCFYIFYEHYDKSLKELAKHVSEIYLIGIETGDTEYAAFGQYLYINFNYLSGAELTELEKKAEAAVYSINKLKQRTVLEVTKIYHQAILYLTREYEYTGKLSGDVFDEDSALPQLIDANDRAVIGNLFLVNMSLSYLFGLYDNASIYAKKTKDYLDALASMPIVPVYYFYDSLIIITLAEKKTNKKQMLRRVINNLKILKKYAHYGEDNYLHKFYLVKAELAKVLGKYLKAEEYYDKAISAAAKSNFINEEALASEQAGKFYFSRGMEKIALTYLTHSKYCYELWGAITKVAHLENTYPELKTTSNKKISKDITANRTYVTYDRNTSQASETLDLITIIKASQAISGEIVYSSLIKKLMKVITESAGAQKIMLIAKNQNTFYKETEYDVRNTDENTVKFYSLDASEQKKFPESIINFVNRTMETLVLNDASKKDEFEADAYIKEIKPKSVICMPLIYQNKLSKILYIENNLTIGAFTEDRIQLLNLLSGQMIISIENAKIYTNLEELVEDRTVELKQEIEERKKAQKLLEKMATHDNLTGLPNRKLFLERLEQTIDFSKRYNLSFCILFIDLDGFKAINDTFGHESGDIVLKTVAERLLDCARDHDTVTRLGGDEFTIILEKINNNSIIDDICNSIITQVGKPILLGEIEGKVTPSIGVSIYPNDGDNINDLVMKADSAMYASKNGGKNRYTIYDSGKVD
ncbi:MAG TPA: serine/threonine-protein kinase PknK [Clostridiales bacterium]|nr:serine/threonine-protein kinase PknK [Clostridiales bacterium]